MNTVALNYAVYIRKFNYNAVLAYKVFDESNILVCHRSFEYYFYDLRLTRFVQLIPADHLPQVDFVLSTTILVFFYFEVVILTNIIIGLLL
jgi:hypothetical protein